MNISAVQSHSKWSLRTHGDLDTDCTPSSRVRIRARFRRRERARPVEEDPETKEQGRLGFERLSELRLFAHARAAPGLLFEGRTLRRRHIECVGRELFRDGIGLPLEFGGHDEKDGRKGANGHACQVEERKLATGRGERGGGEGTDEAAQTVSAVEETESPAGVWQGADVGITLGVLQGPSEPSNRVGGHHGGKVESGNEQGKSNGLDERPERNNLRVRARVCP